LLSRMGTRLVEAGQVVAPEPLEGLAGHLPGLASHPDQGLLQLLVHGLKGCHHAACFSYGALGWPAHLCRWGRKRQQRHQGGGQGKGETGTHRRPFATRSFIMDPALPSRRFSSPCSACSPATSRGCSQPLPAALSVTRLPYGQPRPAATWQCCCRQRAARWLVSGCPFVLSASSRD